MKNRESGLPFDDFRSLLDQLPEFNNDVAQHTREQVNERFGKDSDLFGQICTWFAGWSGRSPSINRPVATLFAGTHAVDGSEDSTLLERISDISAGSDPMNRLCHQNNLGLKVLDLALQIPVADITEEAALDEKSCAGTIAFGMEAIAGGADLLCIAAVERGINVSNLAILSSITGTEPEELSSGDEMRTQLASAAVSLLAGQPHNGFEVLRRLGGRETAAICGAILATRSQHIPAIIAGPTAVASALILESMSKGATAHCRLAQSTGNIALDEIAAKHGIVALSGDRITSDCALHLPIAAGLVSSACLAFSKP